MSHTPATPHSRHFTIGKLAHGVFAAAALKGGAAFINSGIIDLGDRTLIYDTFLTPQAAQDLRAAARDITGRDPEIIVNSHYHNDHIWGNQVFSPHAQIIFTIKTRYLIQTEGKAELEWALGNSAKRLQEFNKQYAGAKSDQERQESLLWGGYYRGMVKDLPSIKVRLPDITFDKRLTIHVHPVRWICFPLRERIPVMTRFSSCARITLSLWRIYYL